MEDFINQLKHYIWELYYAEIINRDELFKMLAKWKRNYYDKLVNNKMQGKITDEEFKKFEE